MKHNNKIIFCNCSYSKVIPADVKKKITGALESSGVSYQLVDDLCRLCADRDAVLVNFTSGKPVTIVACYSRAVKWLLEMADIDLGDKADILNMREQSSDSIIQSLTGSHADNQTDATDESEAKSTDWVPWFPVIDYSRCTNCKQCLNFCLFNVYATSEDGKIIVKNPRKCKTNCPACARVCPQAAIIFPKYKTAPFNGSDETAPPDSPQKIDLKSLTKGDIYNKLRQRSCGCESPDQCGPDNSIEKLTALKEQLDIPDEVIQSLNASGSDTASPGEPCDCDCDCKTDPDNGLCLCETGEACPCDCECKDDREVQS